MKAIAIALLSAVVFVSGIGAGAAADFPITPRQILASEDGHFDIGADLRLPPMNGLFPIVDLDLYATRCDQVKSEASPDPGRVEMFCGVDSRARND